MMVSTDLSVAVLKETMSRFHPKCWLEVCKTKLANVKIVFFSPSKMRVNSLFSLCQKMMTH